jgi:hypothetical protein
VLIEFEHETRRLPATDSPSTLDFGAAADKLRRYAQVAEGRLTEMIALVERLEDLDDVSVLAQLLTDR